MARTPSELAAFLDVSPSRLPPLPESDTFPLLVPRGFASRVRKGDHQVLKNYYLLKGKAKAKMKNKDDYADIVSSGKSFLPLDQTGCKLA